MTLGIDLLLGLRMEDDGVNLCMDVKNVRAEENMIDEMLLCPNRRFGFPIESVPVVSIIITRSCLSIRRKVFFSADRSLFDTIVWHGYR